jgi:hypothetical protein
MTKKIIIVVVVAVFLLLWFKSCHNITRKPTTNNLVIQVLEGLGLLNEKVDQLAADVDMLKVDVRELKNRKGPKTIYRTKTVVVQQPASQIVEPFYYSQPQPSTPAVSQPIVQVRQVSEPEFGTIVPGATPGPQDLEFCIDLEPNKSTDSTKKFLFWELVNGLGYSISNVVPNFTGKSANMKLSPGGSADGISFDGEMLRMSVVSFGNWYAQIMGTPMPSDFRPALRSNKSGWNNRLMTRSGDYFVYRF